MGYFKVDPLFNDLPLLNLILEIVGFGFLLYYALLLGYKASVNLYAFYTTFGNVDLKSYGEWAVVTGCTDGIGKSFAEHFAKQGINVALISRSIDKLNAQAKELEKTYQVDTLVISVDFIEPELIYTEIRKQLADLDIGILVNNVGICYRYPEYFHIFADLESNIDHMINCNIISCTKMTAICLPAMMRKKRGIIINNSSGSGRIPTPMLTVYSATKAYMDFFSQALNVEYADQGIIVQSLCPYYVSTKLSRVKKSASTPTPTEFVASAIKTIGIQSVTNGCLIHNMLGYYYEVWMPRFIYYKEAMKYMLEKRKRALSKRKNQKISNLLT